MSGSVDVHRAIVSQCRGPAQDLPPVEDDFKREAFFYQQALSSAVLFRDAVVKAGGNAFSKPADYFCPMFKDQAQLEKLQKVEAEAESLKKRSEKAKQQRMNKKFGKEIQQKRLEERQKDKKRVIEKIESFKRRRKNAGDASALDAEDDFDATISAPGKSAPGKKRGRFIPKRGGKRFSK